MTPPLLLVLNARAIGAGGEREGGCRGGRGG